MNQNYTVIFKKTKTNKNDQITKTLFEMKTENLIIKTTSKHF